MTLYILGAGPAGLAIAHGLAIAAERQPQQDFVLLDAQRSVGGLAQTLVWDGIGQHDLGPHKIFTLDQDLMRRVHQLLPAEDWLVREKVSSIYMQGYYLPYPPSPFALAKIFGPVKFFMMCFTYGLALVRNMILPGQPKTFADDLQQRLGAVLYEALFKPIAVKLWGRPEQLDIKLSKGRIQTPSVLEIILGLLKIKKKSAFEALTFDYPKGGLQRMWESIVKTSASAGTVRLGERVTALTVSDGRVTAIETQGANGPQQLALGEDDFVVSTLPLGLLAESITPPLPAQVVETCRQTVQLNDLILVFLHLPVNSLLKESWVFVPDPDIVFHRLSEQESFDPGMTPEGTIVCCEVMSYPEKQLDVTDAGLLAATLAGLEKMGYGKLKPLNHRIIRLPKSYPVYRPGYEAGLQQTLAALDGISNLRTVGRQGAFNYIGTLDAMDIGYGFVKWYLNASRAASQQTASWQTERQRTSHYPVLD